VLETGASPAVIPEPTGEPLPLIAPAELNALLAKGEVTVVDFSDSLSFAKRHIPGAWFAIRSRLAESLERLPSGERFVATGASEALTALAAADLRRLSGRPVAILAGGNQAWGSAGFELAAGEENMAADVDDIYRMPFLWGHFEDATEFEAAAKAYLEWELQLPEQLLRAGEIGFVGRGADPALR
jgi:rhodanese-related sulfurtransferase